LRPTEGALAGSQVLPTLFACQRIGGQERTKVVYFAQFWCNHAQVVAPSGGESPLSLDEQPQNDEHDREGVGYGDRHRAHQPVLRSQRASSAFIYLPLYQFRSPTAIVHVRTAGEPLASDSGVMDSSTECGLARLRHFHARSAQMPTSWREREYCRAAAMTFIGLLPACRLFVRIVGPAVQR
jgi:hypothetical protein